jgi:glycosyltransferase involved in cell wall biosynthesis
MRVAVIAPFRIVPPDSGGRRLVFGGCRAYAALAGRVHAYALVTLRDRGRPAAPFPYTEKRTAASLLCVLDRLKLAPKVPYFEAMRLYLPWLARRVMEERPQVVEVHLPWLAGVRRYLPRGIKVVLVMQNVETDWYADALGERPGRAVFARRLARLEGRGVHTADHVICLTPADAAALRERYGAADGKLSVVPPGADVAAAAAPARPRPAGRRRALFVGSAFSGNVEAARRLLAAVGPACGQRLELCLAGDICGALSREPLPAGVRLLGRPEDCAPLYEDADVLLNPGGHATGIHIKVIDALARGCRVVSTPEGARGYEALAGGPILTGGLDAFASLALDARRLGPDEFELVKAFAWPAVARRRLDLYAALCAAGEPGTEEGHGAARGHR